MHNHRGWVTSQWACGGAVRGGHSHSYILCTLDLDLLPGLIQENGTRVGWKTEGTPHPVTNFLKLLCTWVWACPGCWFSWKGSNCQHLCWSQNCQLLPCEVNGGLLSFWLGHKYIKNAFPLLFLCRFCSCALETTTYLWGEEKWTQ